ncbi:hypothetical protein [Paenibacillus sp. RC67]|uniref:hypothetical protein n=1 Tax=Paenibacillus sp. RC67 TaxID=3039392 RepID=UPI0024AD3158|nr:hypothetical protein [Paenibacillus sp. RC67]
MHYERMVKLTDRYVRSLLPKQVLETTDRDYGGFRNPVTLYTDTRPSAYSIIYLLTSYLNSDSTYSFSDDLLHRIQAGIKFLLSRQYSDGTIDLGVWKHAPCEVGFTLSAFCRHYVRLERGGRIEHDELREQLKSYIIKGANAVRDGVLYTPNHRWAAGIAPLASVADLFGDDGYLAKAEDFLADGIDINEDGSYYYENSPNYNTVANKGMLIAARFMQPEVLLDAVRRNLNFIMHNVQPSGESESAFSRRQDRGRSNCSMGGYSMFKEMAVLDSNGQYAKAADLQLDWIEMNGGSPGDFYPALLLLEEDRFREEQLKREELPSRYLNHYRSTGIVRYRNDDFACTLMYDLPKGEVKKERGGREASGNILTVHHGRTVIDGLYIKFAYQGEQSFKPDSITELGEGHYRLEQHYKGWPLHLRHRLEGKREEWMQADLKISVTVRIHNDSVEIEVDSSEGTTNIPISVEWLVRPGSQLAGKTGMQLIENDSITWFSEPEVIIKRDSGLNIEPLSALEITGGCLEHRLPIGYWRVVTGVAEQTCTRLTATGYTPFVRSFQIKAAKH